RDQPAPPSVVFADLVEPTRQPSRPWLDLYDDEIAPTVLQSDDPSRVVWSSLWVDRPDVQIVFDLKPAAGGTRVRWTLVVDKPHPDGHLQRHMCQRIGTLVNANLRYTYGQ
ncbi:hypothetical protein QSJ18_04465, partial [Gordonia sp. ABSL1-1]|uniref:hypothetical protein n=1 Tax=Gordonia sp. ABSL1-1 TaxID=3053923 RepID=UPI002572A35C